MQPILEVKNVTTGFHTDNGVVRAVENISFTVNPSETVCIVGESGSGKSVMSLTALRLIDYDNGKVLEGEILFNGENLLKKSPEEMRKIRGGEIAMIFQEPMTALNPVFTIGKQITEAVMLHKNCSKEAAMKRAKELLTLVGISEPEIRLKQYPHELSGGMRQRVMIAVALSCEPKLLIADEPTTALDVTIQAQILNLLQELKERLNMAIILITHDIGVAAQLADKIVVMYAGKVVEEGSVYEIFDKPKHPYTLGLLSSIPTIDGDRSQRLTSIKGSIPSLMEMPEGCRFNPRCSFATERCAVDDPVLESIGTRKIACWNHGKVMADFKLSV
ncbi:ABC transporter ATP-binding protein [Bacillus sp. B-jedd]|uniref:ABC transporter ATP-binding protein n=1 Tax=Bacillus sp. B-jedd TaxID=1476857 RepID=UPI0005156906|nr:ABC transporter ATP-binding protein [Bacillus sp. B-jedd]CEG28714.1 oligopeptide ABC transporter ATP-binding protein AppD [Bacillus sp. B-jedd]